MSFLSTKGWFGTVSYMWYERVFIFLYFFDMIVWLKDRLALDRTMVTKTYTIGNKNLTFESGQLALFATWSVVIKDEDGNFLLTTCGIGNAKDGDFFPLTVEFQEKYYANGKIGGNRFMKREGRPSEASILNSRLIDRPIRPMFPKGTRTDTQIISTIMSSSGVSDFGWYGITGASMAIMLAGVEEFEGPVAWVRICRNMDWKFVFDPTFEEIEQSTLDLTVAGTLDAITMVESQWHEVESDTMIAALEYAHNIICDLCRAQQDFVATYTNVHTLPDTTLTVVDTDETVVQNVESLITEENILDLYNLWKIEFHDALRDLVESIAEKLEYDAETNTPKMSDIADAVKKVVSTHMRKTVLEKKVRLDGRKLDEVRPVQASASILPRAHGSALFERWVTQALSVTTLGWPSDIQIIDGMYDESSKRYIHHYNFPPYSVGEVKPLRGVGRREVGHGRLAEKALEPVLPDAQDFPYMIRVVSETVTCNGSSSMASVCGSTMSLMDAGVPIKAMVAGVAMGMIYDEENNRFEILSDIQAQEDFLGDMDFKVARTQKGITALQMDCKIAGLSMDVIKAVFDKSSNAIDYIMGEMRQCLDAPRKELSQYAPFLLAVFVPEDKMRDVIWKGGETIQWIEKDFGVEVNLEDDGNCTVTAKTQEAGKQAITYIKNILKDIEVDDVYEWKIVKILDTIGAIVEIAPGKEGMIHISKFGSKERINNVNDVAKVGDIVSVKVYNVDKEKWRIGLEKITQKS